jgi:hypothetical protein
MSNYVVTKAVITRPGIQYPFKADWPEMPEGGYKQYIKQTYVDTGKILSTSDSISEDSLTLTSTNVWVNEAERTAFMNDPVVKRHFEFLTNYRKSAGISHTWINKEYNGNAVIREWSGTW